MQVKAKILKIKVLILSATKYLNIKIASIHNRNFTSYDSEDFKKQLRNIGIYPGDSIFIMHSQDKINLMSKQANSAGQILSDIMDYLGSESTIMVLGFSLDSVKILNKERLFDVKRTPTDSGIFAEIVRRKKGSIRSLHPFLSAISYGRKANEFCDDHHKSSYPFDRCSPYYKIMESGGKYLGIGVGFEAFTPCHMLEDHYKEGFKHKIYHHLPQDFTVIDKEGKEQYHAFFVRNPLTCPYIYDPHNYFKILGIPHKNIVTKSGIKLFSFKMQDFFESAVNLYDREKKTVWDTGNLAFTIRRNIQERLSLLLR